MLTVTGSLQAQSGASPAPASEQELLLLVDVNDQKLDETVLALQLPDGGIAVQGESLDRWRLRRPQAPPLIFHGAAYYALDSMRGVRYSFDSARQRLTIAAAPEAFTSAQYVNVATPYGQPTPSPLGGFLNYELFASHGSGVTQYAGQFETGIFTSQGVFTTSQLEQDDGNKWSSVRLDTTWRSDFPDKLTTLRVGDAINTPAAWGRAVRFGGIQYQTNFTTQPGFIAYPSIAANGSAALPSTVDVFVNNALVAQRPVPPGPFSITNIPTINGSGNVQLVVRDLFGREQIITQPFYGSVNLLKAGLDQFSYEAGFERQNFGTNSNDYGPGVGSATYLRGLTDQFTGEVHAEATRDLFAGGLAANYLWNEIGILSAAVAGSGGGAGSGALAGMGFQRQTSSWSVAAQGAWSTRNFNLVGATPEDPVPLRLWSANVGYQADQYGSFSVTYVAQDFRSKPNVHVLSAGYGVRLGPWAFFNVTAAKTFGASGGTSIAATVTVPFGELSTASAAYNGTRSRQGNTNEGVLTLQRSLPLGEGYGYRLVAHTHDDYEGEFAYQNNFGTYSIEAARFQGATSERLDVTGGIGMVGGHPFLSRQITDSFAVVRVADYPGVGVLQDNQPVGRTGAEGYAMLPSLRAYDINPVSIDQNDLPLDAEVDKLKIEVVPYYRSGLLLDFPVRRAHGGTLHITLDDGAPMPSGATVRIAGRDEEFPVALQGEAYLTGLEQHNRLRASWKGRSCEFDADLPVSADPIPDLGRFVCHGVTR
ncbi:MAG TPA: fimbria/pilus outer membrane usher protein [Casimicrobiaceae bacterium]|nr:fimbria/pilus outer membrane usher protein [Casimicrobiaceae bacterium]